jgi:ABC-type Na+ efflux pump permease subunit
MPIRTIAGKDLRLLARDPRSLVILLVMPLLLILVLGLSIGEMFGRKPDDRIRISVVIADAGLSMDGKRWSDTVLADLTDTADIRVERIPDFKTANSLVKTGERSAVVVFEPEFSEKVQRCSFTGEPFTKDPINPLYRDGMRTSALGVTLLRNPTQPVAASVIEQVVQVTLLRVVIPWMIGNAFELIGSDEFMNRMEKHIPALKLAYPFLSRKQLGEGIQKGIGAFFSEYRFTAKTWAGLTNSSPPPPRDANKTVYVSQDDGLLGLKRGTVRYQTLVPSYVVTFAFFLVLTVGWLFVAERKHGTLTRLKAAPITKAHVLFGKMIPAIVISLVQGFFLLICGKLIFGMSWGPMPWLLIPVVVATSFAAVGLSMLVASVARNEAQVAVYGTLVVLLLAGISGSLMPRDLMPDTMRKISLATPHAWALDAYSQLLANPEPQAGVVLIACGVLMLFGLAFTLLAWRWMKLD